MRPAPEMIPVLIDTARTLKGSQRRHFMAKTVEAMGRGGQVWAEAHLGWNRETKNGSFTGDFENQAAGKTNTTNFINEGADIIMPVAGPVGLGTVAGFLAESRELLEPEEAVLVKDFREFGSDALHACELIFGFAASQGFVNWSAKDFSKNLPARIAASKRRQGKHLT